MKYCIKQLAAIIAARDGISEDEAIELVLDTQAEIYDAIDGLDYIAAEDIFMSNLGLELDYFMYIL